METHVIRCDEANGCPSKIVMCTQAAHKAILLTIHLYLILYLCVFHSYSCSNGELTHACICLRSMIRYGISIILLVYNNYIIIIHNNPLCNYVYNWVSIGWVVKERKRNKSI